MNDNQYRGRTAIARSERVQSCVRQLAREHPSFADELRRAFDHFQLLIARRAEPSRTEEGAWERPNPDSLERDDLSRLSDGDFHTVALYRLGGLADMGLARPIVPKPEESGDWKPDMADYRRWARRFPATDHTRHTENPELSVEALPPLIAEEFLAHAEAWVREHAENGAASAESSFQADAPRETGTNTTRAASGEGVVPAGGGGTETHPNTASDQDSELRAALYTLAGNLNPCKPGSAGSVIRSQVENRLRQVDANQRALNSGLGGAMVASSPTPGIEAPTQLDRITAMLYFPCSVELAQQLRENVVRRVCEAIDRAVQSVDNGAGLRLQALTAGKLTAAELATSLLELRRMIEYWSDGLDKAVPFDSELPSKVFAIASDAGKAATLLGRKVSVEQHAPVGSASGGYTKPNAPAINQTAIERAAERGAQLAVEKAAQAFGGSASSDAKPAPLPLGAATIDDHPSRVVPPPDFAHADDFQWVIWAGEKYDFSKGNQAESVRSLWHSWEKSGRRDGCGLSEKTIGEKCGSSSSDFRLAHVFRNHPAWGKMIRSASKGVFALFAESPQNHTS